ncbi:DUF3006 domain-containing protein [Natronobacterium gregoryi]|uniref:DUF3006 domain-containing protein n=2 Tax=Natronobacterium gregoryi TaxID=44930 RepID=L0AKJ0_NATGS|nr:DUF3006 domain-containing protein [Natronobacterium gregoryi]AFZ74418.1 Protein of unknown function (DUF3006) [Natronobacterium gregoryi SP2]ELY72122.1 hypothetical protein C490_04182 [Natronobacterium gregoryi SP2]PLK19747.1 DUF3006 domain-containing protein [Natronobacterium gregoryi SP2]SFJ40618.1 Protein of unknown function [Natronobacterium gregoryi]
MTESFTGVVDRVVDGETAVILLEEDGETVDQLDVPLGRLPEPARDEGAILSITVSAGELVDAESRPEETSDRRESARERLKRLSDRLSER